MNANLIHGTVRSLVGKAQEHAGHLLGSRKQVLRGLQRQVLGGAEKRLGDLQEAARRTIGHDRGLHL